MKAGAFFILFSVLFSTSGAWAQISYREYRTIKGISDSIVRQYPPSEYLYVGVGASPTGLMAYLELTLGSRSVVQLPLSGGMALSRAYQVDSKRAAEIDGILQEHFRRFLPDWRIGNKKILLIDYSIKAITLPLAGERLQEALRLRGNSAQIQMLALHRNPEIVESLNQRGIDSYRVSVFAQGLFITQRFDEYRLYERFEAQKFESRSDYRPPELRVAETHFSDFMNRRRMGHFSPGHYKFLLQELQTWMEKDFAGRHFFVRPQIQAFSGRCSEIFSY